MDRTLNNEAIEALAEALGSEHEIYDDTGRADVIELVETLGGRVCVDDNIDADRPASMSISAIDDFTVMVPWNTSVVRDRFTVAHEIGHLKLHYAGEGSATFYRFGRNAQETEANLFAAALLMPREAFEREFKQCEGDVSCLAKKFDVSLSTTKIRAQVLGLS